MCFLLQLCGICGPWRAEAQGGLTASQNALIDQAIEREKEVVRVLKERTPLVETYIQNMQPDEVMREIPKSDQHFFGRVDFSAPIIGYKPYRVEYKAPQQKVKRGLGEEAKYVIQEFRGGQLEFSAVGFVQMLLMDSNDFNREHYRFRFVRNDSLGALPTAVFDVIPTGGKKKAAGRFFGRMWVETKGGNVVRFNGEFASAEKHYHDYFHFDSWRTNSQPNLWLPSSVFVDESDEQSKTGTLKFKAATHVWGYTLKDSPNTAESASIEVKDATDVSEDAKDVGPLASSRALSQQAEDNVIERLFEAGLLDAPSEFDRQLEAIANNILFYNKAEVPRPIHVRTLLTEPLESFAVGYTIVVSKGLIDSTAVLTADSMQQMGNLSAVLAFQVAHILLGHALDTTYAFNDRLLFPNDAVLQHLPLQHSDSDNVAAAAECLRLLEVKELAGSRASFGLYLQQLKRRRVQLTALNQSLLGDGLAKNGLEEPFWLEALLPKTDEIRDKDLEQRAAAPLGSYLGVSPWTDEVVRSMPAFQPMLSASDKQPFEVQPVFLKLEYFGAKDASQQP